MSGGLGLESLVDRKWIVFALILFSYFVHHGNKWMFELVADLLYDYSVCAEQISVITNDGRNIVVCCTKYITFVYLKLKFCIDGIFTFHGCNK